MSRQYVIAGNWKMNKTINETVDYMKNLATIVKDTPHSVYLAVPFTALYSASKETHGNNITVGAQNMHHETHGAFTGEASATMIKDAGASFVLIGHSERRHVFNESNDFINKKIHRAIKENIQPILCIGELLGEREEGKTNDVLAKQLTEGLKDVSISDLKNIIVAYEPVWAIGTGKTATPEIAQEAHNFIRSYVRKNWGDAIADDLIIQYGGSVKPENAHELMKNEDIDGVLVGGASLKPDVFGNIVNFEHYQSPQKV
jgi:triosephosphate isomerase (TIM)